MKSIMSFMKATMFVCSKEIKRKLVLRVDKREPFCLNHFFLSLRVIPVQLVLMQQINGKQIDKSTSSRCACHLRAFVFISESPLHDSCNPCLERLVIVPSCISPVSISLEL